MAAIPAVTVTSTGTDTSTWVISTGTAAPVSPTIAPANAGSAIAAVPSGSVTVSTAAPAAPGASGYVIIIQIPVPFLSIQLDLAAVLSAALTALEVPQAIAWLTSNATSIFGPIINDAILLLKAIPQGSITIQVKLGTIIVVNIELIAVRKTVAISTPTFKLALPSLAAGLDYKLPLESVVVEVPIPVPNVGINVNPLLKVTGGQVAASVGSNAAQAVTPQPLPVTDLVYLPKI
jgi:hypothetical protein